MQIEGHNEHSVTISLSERNLKHLLGALAAFEAGAPGMEPFLERFCENGMFLRVVAQTDHEHYERVERTPGPGFDGLVEIV